MDEDTRVRIAPKEFFKERRQLSKKAEFEIKKTSEL
jgi:hypothetical protein